MKCGKVENSAALADPILYGLIDQLSFLFQKYLQIALKGACDFVLQSLNALNRVRHDKPKSFFSFCEAPAFIRKNSSQGIDIIVLRANRGTLSRYTSQNGNY